MFDRQRVGAIIAAAGSSQRMGIDKVFAPLDGTPLVAHCLAVFEASPLVDEIVLVVGADNVGAATRLVAEMRFGKVAQICQGGPRRQDSVANGLHALGPCDWVLVHDGARPLVTGDLIATGLAAAREAGAAVAAVPVKDTIKIATDSCQVAATLPRERLWAVQTPQVFRCDWLAEGYRKVTRDVTDDALVIEEQGLPVKLYLGSYENIKVTTPEDLEIAEIILRRRAARTH